MKRIERAVVQIDAEKCVGCGACVDACAEGAIQMVEGKARLVSEEHCDGLGACLGPCPAGAITLVARRAASFDAAAVNRLCKVELQQFTKNAHAIKGVSSIVGAQLLSAKAAALEIAGKAGDTIAIQRDFPDFFRDLETITERIRTCLENDSVSVKE